MKKRIVSLLVVVALVLSSNMMSFAGVVQTSNFKDGDIEVKSNRYYYKTVTELEDSYEKEVSEEEAATTQKYDSAIRELVGAAITAPVGAENPVSSIVGYFVGKLLKRYHSNYDCAGKYNITKYSVKRIQVDRLKHTQRVVKRGVKYEIEFDEEIIYYKTFWY